MRRIALNGGVGCYNPGIMGLGATDTDCPCEVQEVTENKTVTIPVKSQKIICKPTTVREGVVDCETIQRALGRGGTNNSLPNTNNQTNTNNANANNASLLGMGNLDVGFNLDLISLAVGGAVGYLFCKYM